MLSDQIQTSCTAVIGPTTLMTDSNGPFCAWVWCHLLCVVFHQSQTVAVAGTWCVIRFSLKEASGMLKLTVVSRCFISSKYAMARFALHHMLVHYSVTSCSKKIEKSANVSCWSQLRPS